MPGFERDIRERCMESAIKELELVRDRLEARIQQYRQEVVVNVPEDGVFLSPTQGLFLLRERLREHGFELSWTGNVNPGEVRDTVVEEESDPEVKYLHWTRSVEYWTAGPHKNLLLLATYDEAGNAVDFKLFSGSPVYV